NFLFHSCLDKQLATFKAIAAAGWKSAEDHWDNFKLAIKQARTPWEAFSASYGFAEPIATVIGENAPESALGVLGRVGALGLAGKAVAVAADVAVPLMVKLGNLGRGAESFDVVAARAATLEENPLFKATRAA